MIAEYYGLYGNRLSNLIRLFTVKFLKKQQHTHSSAEISRPITFIGGRFRASEEVTIGSLLRLEKRLNLREGCTLWEKLMRTDLPDGLYCSDLEETCPTRASCTRTQPRTLKDLWASRAIRWKEVRGCEIAAVWDFSGFTQAKPSADPVLY